MPSLNQRRCALLMILLKAVLVDSSPVAFSGSYVGPGGKFAGFKPSTIGPHPVFVWIPGTGDEYFPPLYQFLTYQMAMRGFASVSVQYDMAIRDAEGDLCVLIPRKANTIFTGPSSALGVLCAMIDVNCSRGVAIAGHSQGGFIAMLAAKTNGMVTAQLALSVGMCNNFPPDEKSCRCFAASSCFANAALSPGGLPQSKRRYIVGADDLIVASPMSPAIGSMKAISGYDCGANLSCIQADGSGYFIVTGASYQNSSCNEAPHALHWTMDPVIGAAELLCGGLSSSAWSLPSSLDWLARAAAPHIHVASVSPRLSVNGTLVSCKMACPPGGSDLCRFLRSLKLGVAGFIVSVVCCCCCCVSFAICCCMNKKNRASVVEEARLRPHMMAKDEGSDEEEE